MLPCRQHSHSATAALQFTAVTPNGYGTNTGGSNDQHSPGQETLNHRRRSENTVYRANESFRPDRQRTVTLRPDRLLKENPLRSRRPIHTGPFTPVRLKQGKRLNNTDTTPETPQYCHRLHLKVPRFHGYLPTLTTTLTATLTKDTAGHGLNAREITRKTTLQSTISDC